jgi:hypothetical protein
MERARHRLRSCPAGVIAPAALIHRSGATAMRTALGPVLLAGLFAFAPGLGAAPGDVPDVVVHAIGDPSLQRESNDLGGGVLITHHPPGLLYTSDTTDWCAVYPPITSCAEQNPRIDDGSHAVVWYVLAAWYATDKVWCGTEFGLGSYAPSSVQWVAQGVCPASALTIPYGGWPGPNTGISLATTSQPWAGNYRPVYFFVSYAYASGTVPLIAHPSTGFAGFANCLTPPIAYDAVCLGAMGLFQPGTACCPPDQVPEVCCIGEACQLVLEAQCAALGGVWHPEWSTCAPNPCARPHVCCVDGVCHLVLLGACGNLGGEWHAEWDSCVPDPCVLQRACCIGETCQLATLEECPALGGVWHSDWESCAPNPCAVAHVCCVGEECVLVYEAECATLGGVWHPEWSACTTDRCRVRHVCCVGGTCYLVYEDSCTSQHGTWHPDWNSCTGNPCAIPHVCCVDDDCYLLTTSGQCFSLGGTWHSDWGSCSPNPCLQRFVCCVGETCNLVHDSDECDALDGAWHPAWSSCDPNLCLREAVCCVGTVCYLVRQPDCAGLGGLWFPEWASCDPNPCADLSADLADGVLIAHHPPGLVYTDGTDWCAAYAPIHICADQNPIIDDGAHAVVWYVLAAWSGDRTWCGVELGLGGYNPSIVQWVDHGACPSSALTIPSGSWPGPGTGIAIAATSQNWQGNYQPVYFLACYAYGTGTIPLTSNPATGFGGFANCLTPPASYEADCFGAMGLFEPGTVCCPPATVPRVCCVGETCSLVLEEECAVLGGAWHPGWGSCGPPNPCSTARVCCVGEVCHFVHEDECSSLGGVWHPEWYTCGPPEPCFVPGPNRACCVGDVCYPSDYWSCESWGGTWHPEWTDCGPPDRCPYRVCCVGWDCYLTDQVDCESLGGAWAPDLFDCEPNNPCLTCGERGVCCTGDNCAITSPGACWSLGGTWDEDLQSCFPSPCADSLAVCPDGSLPITTLQQAVDAAVNFQTIILCDGVYQGAGNRDVVIDRKSLTIASGSGDPERCVISCGGTSGEPHRGFDIRLVESAPLTISGVTIRGGFAAGDGGAMLCAGGAPVIDNCRIVGNEAANGGALAWRWPTGRVSDRSVDVTLGSSRGGERDRVPSIVDCVISGNRATAAGGGLLLANAPVSAIYGCTFSGNRAGSTGGAIQATMNLARLSVSNSILWGDCAATEGSEVYLTPAGASLRLANCDVAAGGISGPGSVTWESENIHADPFFCDPRSCEDAPTLAGDYHLSLNSPCVTHPDVLGGPYGALGIGCDARTSIETGATEDGRIHLGAVVPGVEGRGIRILYTIPRTLADHPVLLRIFDSTGRLIRVLGAADQAAGAHVILWDGTDLGGQPVDRGVYFCRLEVGASRLTRRLVLVR